MGKGGLKELILEVLHQGLGRNLIYATRPWGVILPLR